MDHLVMFTLRCFLLLLTFFIHRVSMFNTDPMLTSQLQISATKCTLCCQSTEEIDCRLLLQRSDTSYVDLPCIGIHSFVISCVIILTDVMYSVTTIKLSYCCC